MRNRFTTTTRVNLEKEPIYVVILAGSSGYREKSADPKILKIHLSESILEHQVKTILHVYPDAIISVTSGFKADKVIRHRPQISLIENQLWETTNSIEELRLYLNTVFPHRLIIIDGPVYFNRPALNIVSTTSLLSYQNDDIKEIGMRSDNGYVEHLGYGIDGDKWGGIAYLEGKALSCLRKICNRDNNKLSTFEGLNLLLEQNIQFKKIDNKAEIVKL